MERSLSITRVLRKEKFDEGFERNAGDHLYLTRAIHSNLIGNSRKELDSLFGDLKNGVIIIDETFHVRYFNSAVLQIDHEQNISSSPNNTVLNFIKTIINPETLLRFYEHMMTKSHLVLDDGFLIPRIDKLILSPVTGSGFVIKVLINELYTESAANLFHYFPHLPFAYCGISLDTTRKLKIEFYSDNFRDSHLNTNGNNENEHHFDRLIHPEDLPSLLKHVNQIRKGKNTPDSFELRMLHGSQEEYKWFRVYISRYRDHFEKNLCIVYLQNVHFEKLMLKEEEELVQEILDEERERMAMELHDGLGQQLIAVNLHLNMLRETISDTAGIDKCSTILKDSILQMKSMCYNLAPPEFEKGLLNSVDKLFAKLNEMSKHIHYRFVAKKIPIRDLSSEEAYNIYRIIQEFVSNSQKYADCSEITCEIGRRNDSVAVLIYDNGKGFDPKQVTTGFGLANIEKRAKLAKAKIEYNSAIGEGTYLLIEF